MSEDRFAGRPQPGGVQHRAERRETCALTVRGDAPRPTARRGSVGPETAAPTFASTELTALEQAVVSVLPQWPEAWEAVMEYARRSLPAGLSLQDPNHVPEPEA